MDKNYHKNYYQEYKKSKKGLIAHMYNGQLSSSRRRNHPKPNYSLKELRNFLFDSKKFSILFKEWEANNYIREMVPSLDRIDATLPYSLNNLQIMTWKDNRVKRFSDCSQVPKSDNKSGITGVSFNTHYGKWVSQIIFNKIHIWLGQYLNKEDAIISRKIAEQILNLNNYGISKNHSMYEKILKYIKKKCDP